MVDIEMNEVKEGERIGDNHDDAMKMSKVAEMKVIFASFHEVKVIEAMARAQRRKQRLRKSRQNLWQQRMTLSMMARVAVMPQSGKIHLCRALWRTMTQLEMPKKNCLH